MERQCTPHHHQRGQAERRPLPVRELRGRDHRQHDHRHGKRGTRGEGATQRGELALVRRLGLVVARGGFRLPRGVAGALDHGHEVVDRHAAGVHDSRAAGRVVDVGLHPVELAQRPLDARCARSARHAVDAQLGLEQLSGRRLRGDRGHRRASTAV
jgi:hypothetical protein